MQMCGGCGWGGAGKARDEVGLGGLDVERHEFGASYEGGRAHACVCPCASEGEGRACPQRIRTAARQAEARMKMQHCVAVLAPQQCTVLYCGAWLGVPHACHALHLQPKPTVLIAPPCSIPQNPPHGRPGAPQRSSHPEAVKAQHLGLDQPPLEHLRMGGGESHASAASAWRRLHNAPCMQRVRRNTMGEIGAQPPSCALQQYAARAMTRRLRRLSPSSNPSPLMHTTGCAATRHVRMPRTSQDDDATCGRGCGKSAIPAAPAP